MSTLDSAPETTRDYYDRFAAGYEAERHHGYHRLIDELELELVRRYGHGRDVFEGRPILVRFIWSGITTPTPRWEQSFSDDGGATWETNWIMEFSRADDL